ncbi:MAG: hypothetical protein E6248_03015 [Clostridium sp.]|uniref:hypothetical protein n=1 Tax=Clostridium sp. TaxID=1506 RepID=UPI00290CAE9D|nr:hypothetical protein [Clostridium sp.]MDU5109391.1 hypothetical protein [Clostridium sp.]
MRKVIGIIILSILMLVVVGCQGNKTDNISNDILIEDENSVRVEILATSDSDSLEGMPITLKPKVNGEHNKEIQYHWILKNDNDFEGFILQDNGPQKDIINSGEPVELGLFAMVEWVEGTVKELKVELQVEDKETSDIIATDEIIIENNQGTYSIK